MCGIVGIFDTRGTSEIDRELLNQMNETQFHRGPDAGGLHIEAGVGLGHRRLSIIDLSTGKQPMTNEDQTVWVTFNGEIYNFPALSVELKKLGHRFKTHSDTEVIVHAWEEWGEDCVKRFRGMFAFAIWDSNQQMLFLARDRLGKKPFYYSLLPNGLFVFGSEMKSLMLHQNLNRTMDSTAIEDYFALGYVPDPKSIFTSIKKIPPAHTLLLKRGKSIGEPKEYWDICFEPINQVSEEDAQLELIEKLTEAVKIRMMSEVPLGAFLSGGVDSSAMVALMAQLNPGTPVNTCSIGFGDPKFNETEFAQMIADQYKTNHYVEHVEANDFDLLDKLAGIYDEPFADSSSMPTYRVCELAKKRVTVVISGDGGDENFAGYRRHRWHMNEEKVRQMLPGPLRKPVFGMLGAAYPKMDWAPKMFRAKSTFQSLSKDSFEAYLHSISVVVDGLRSQLFSQNFNKQLGGYHASEVFKYHANRASTKDPLSLIQYIDMKTYLPGDILVKVDRASMAHGLEVRVPILDHEFMEWSAKLAPSLKLRGQEGKYIFKKSLEPYLPNDVLYRPKMGFGVPISGWFRGPLKERVREAVLGEQLADTNMFDQKFLKKLVDEHQSGMGEHSAALWSLLMFESFLRNVA